MNNLTEINTSIELNTDLVQKDSLSDFVVKKILLPIKAGMVGFTIILSILVIRELYFYTIDSSSIFELDVLDVLLSSVGFVCLFLLYLLKNGNKDDLKSY